MKKVLAVIMSLVISLSVCPAAFAGKSASENRTEKTAYGLFDNIEQNGLPAVTPNVALKVLNKIWRLFGIITGTVFFQKNWEITVDETITGLCKYISDMSALDVYYILTEIPDIQDPQRLMTDILPVDMVEVRAAINDYREKLIEQGNLFGAGICHMIADGLSVVEKADIYAVKYPEKGENVINVMVDVTLRDGTVDTFDPPIYIDLDTGLAYGRDNKGMLSLGFDFNVYELTSYATINSWQRKYGFFFGYDLFCYLSPSFNYNTRRFKFNYGDKEWMIQVWKGKYFFATGAEIGIYNRDKKAFGTYYYCISDDELMTMSLTLKHGDETLINMPPQKQWWLNAFKVGTRVYLPRSLTEYFTIEFEDAEMMDAFVKSVNNHYRHDVQCTVDGMTVSCVW
ncbi:MAG: DUF4474 domain-containing protein [Clostridiales bacterium]|nr:DUF4474 domain-containing protein [Clostridiales bacterium]